MDGETVQDEDAGFDSFGTEDATPTATPVVEEVVAEVTPEVVEEPEAPAPEFMQITKSQFDDLMNKASQVDTLRTMSDKAFGKIGGIERVLTELKQQPQGQPVQLSEDDFAELKGEFPELAELQMKGMKRLMDKLRVPQVDASAIEQMVGAQTSNTRAELVDTTLDAIVDGDWKEEVKTDKFAQWIDGQGNDVKALGSSDSLRDAAKLMRLFKAHKDAPPPAPTPAPTNSTSRRIAAAVAPKGTNAVTSQNLTEEDAFNAYSKG
jgi:hypothetical protein